VIVKPLPNELREILLRIAESGLVPASPRDYVIPNRRRARNPERSPTVIYQTSSGGRAGVNAHPTRSAPPSPSTSSRATPATSTRSRS
jgi:hypothetical protein